MVGDSMWIFGGKDGNEQYFNDIYVFSASAKTWTKLSVEGCVPPPLAYFASTSTIDCSLMIHGGEKSDKSLSDKMYRFDSSKKIWIEYIIFDKFPRKGHAIFLKGINMYMIGGVDELGNFRNDIYIIENLLDGGAPSPFFENMFELLKNEDFSDFTLRLELAEDKQKDFRLHKCVLAARSPYFDHYFQTSGEYSHIMVLDMPHLGFKAAAIEAFLEFLYTGSIRKISADSYGVADLMRVSCYFANGTVLNRQLLTLCTERIVSFDVVEEIQKTLKGHLFTLLSGDKYSDLRIRMNGDEADFPDPVPAGKSSGEAAESFTCHKCLITCRSNFFKAMLASGFQESAENEIAIHLKSQLAFRAVMRYLYAEDFSEVTPEVVAEVLQAAYLMALDGLQEKCRQLISRTLDPENCCSVMDIAEVFSDKVLKRICLLFIKRNWQSVNANLKEKGIDLFSNSAVEVTRSGEYSKETILLIQKVVVFKEEVQFVLDF